MLFFAEGFHLFTGQCAGLPAGVHTHAGGQRAVQVAGQGGHVLRIPEQVQVILPCFVMRTVRQLPFLNQGCLLDRTSLPEQRFPRQCPVHLGNKQADRARVEKDQVCFDQQVASFRRPVYGRVNQDLIHHGNHRDKLPHEIKAAFLRTLKDGNVHLCVGFQDHPGDAAAVRVDHVFHARMGVQHLPNRSGQVFRGDILCSAGHIRQRIGGFASAGQAFQVDAHLGFGQRVYIQVHGWKLYVLFRIQICRQFPGCGMSGNILEG